MEVFIMKSKFEAMSRQELRSYVLQNRDNDEAFQVYMDRALAEPGEIYPAPQTIDDLKDFPFSKKRVTSH
jgi:phenylacetate-coenzyme A ligase PaaK-like adenylate-forming protein